MAVIGTSLLFSTWCAFFLDASHALAASAGVVVLGLLAARLQHHKDWRWLRTATVCCFSAAVALALHARYEVQHLQPFLRLDGEVVTVEGVVQTAQIRGRSARYQLSAHFPENPHLPAVSLQLRAYGEMDFLPGDTLRASVRLQPKAQPAAGLRHSADNLLDALLEDSAERLNRPPTLRTRLLFMRQRMRGNLRASLSGETAAVVAGMVLGQDADIPPSVYSTVNRAGTVHLLSVSGLHLSVLTGMVLRALKRLGVSTRLRSLAGIGTAVAFCALVGLAPSVVRAGVMTGATLAAGLGRRRSDSLSSLGFAVTLICLLFPDWVLSRGLWLSAGATLGILLFVPRLEHAIYTRLQGDSKLYNRGARLVADSFSISIAAYVFTLPLSIAFTGWISVVSPLANLLIAPFVPLVILGGAGCAAIRGGSLLIRLLSRLTEFSTAAILQISKSLADLPFATATLDETWMLLWLLPAAALVAIPLFLRKDRRLAAYGATLSVLLFCTGSLSQALATRQTAELAAVDGCDVAVLLQDGNAVILGTPTPYEINRLLRYLEFRGVRRVQAVVAADCGEQVGSGLSQLAERYPPDCIIGPDDSYILGEIAAALPDVPVYSGGYASIQALGGLQIKTAMPGNDIFIVAKNNRILKTSEKYAIMKHKINFTVGLYPDDIQILHGAAGREPAPIGHLLYGEQRFRLQLLTQEDRHALQQ